MTAPSSSRRFGRDREAPAVGHDSCGHRGGRPPRHTEVSAAVWEDEQLATGHRSLVLGDGLGGTPQSDLRASDCAEIGIQQLGDSAFEEYELG